MNLNRNFHSEATVTRHEMFMIPEMFMAATKPITGNPHECFVAAFKSSAPIAHRAETSCVLMDAGGS